MGTKEVRTRRLFENGQLKTESIVEKTDDGINGGTVPPAPPRRTAVVSPQHPQRGLPWGKILLALAVTILVLAVAAVAIANYLPKKIVIDPSSISGLIPEVPDITVVIPTPEITIPTPEITATPPKNTVTPTPTEDSTPTPAPEAVYISTKDLKGVLKEMFPEASIHITSGKNHIVPELAEVKEFLKREKSSDLEEIVASMKDNLGRVAVGYINSTPDNCRPENPDNKMIIVTIEGLAAWDPGKANLKIIDGDDSIKFLKIFYW